MEPNESEWTTRKKRIDPKLDATGWRLRSGGAQPPAYRSEEEGTANGPADYALWLNNQVVGIVEAKKRTVGPQNVLTQTELYARGLNNRAFNFRELHRPFLCSKNGEMLWFHDVRDLLDRSRRISGVHTANTRTELLGRDLDADCEKLLALPRAQLRLTPEPGATGKKQAPKNPEDQRRAPTHEVRL